ncbi:Cilia- and flagella-associated protein 58 [Frankliniella fusca]|uniref:Cilia- and flagella-associated protein 58 n=1 Tax=Frankliniella fusca TaxID=407009 RepID=A0AAE1HD00_9NEOP|nr:Cilia- and flagella-associated protein 58 [Frankliniella fusca]
MLWRRCDLQAGTMADKDGDEAVEVEAADPVFAALEQDLRKTLAQMQRRPGMAAYSTEMKRALDALVENHEAAVRYEAACRELTARVAADTERTQALAQQALQEQQASQQQRQELEQAWRRLDTSHAREQELQELVDDLRRQVNKLNMDLEQKARLGLDQGDDFGMLTKTREGLAKEREKLSQDVLTLKDRLARAAATRAELEQQVNVFEQRLQDLAQEMEVQANELSKETRLKEKLQEEVRALLADLEHRTADAANLSFQLAQANRNAHRGEAALRDQKASGRSNIKCANVAHVEMSPILFGFYEKLKGLANERLAKEAESLVAKLSRAQTELETQAIALDKAIQDSHRKNTELRAREDELSKMRTEVARLSKAREAAEKRARQEEAWRSEQRAERERLQASLAVVERAAEQADRQQRAARAELDRTARDKAVTERQLLALKMELAEQRKAAAEVEQASAQLRLEVQRCEEALAAKAAEAEQLAADNDKCTTQAAHLAQQVRRSKRDVFHLQVLVESGRRRLQEAEQQLAARCKEGDSLRLEANKLERQLALARDESHELKDKLQAARRDATQLKEEVSSREFMLFKSRSELQRSERDRDSLRLQVQGLQLQVETQRASLGSARLAEDGLQQQVKQLAAEKQEAQRQLAQARDETALLAAQLQRRSEEARLLHEKTRILGSVLAKGRQSYARRQDDVRLLRVEIKRLRLEKRNLAAMIRNSAELRLELYQTTRQLTHSQVKCRALEEELHTPLNVHRWRRLEGTDPPHFELVMKLQLLQRRLLAQSAQVLVREAQLREAEEKQLQLQLELSRAPGPQLQDQLQQCQRLLAERSRRLKCLASEVRMHETRAEAHQVEQQKAQEEIALLKQKYFQLKKREQQLRELHGTCQVGSLTLSQLLGRARVLGGGYNLSLQPPRELDEFSETRTGQEV